MKTNVETDAGASAELARFAATLALDAIPRQVIQRVRECLLDFIANAAFAARHAESSTAFRAAVDSLAPTGGAATVVAEARTYPLQYAALLNGAYAHTLDFDDTSLFGSIHPGAAVIPAALAMAEAEGAGGSALLEALVAGYEIACRVGAAIGTSAYDRGFHNTPIAGIFGAVAAAGRLARLSVVELQSAFGLAGSQAAGSMQYLENGAWNKRLHPGFAAHDALLAVAFARAGVLGASAPIEGRYGLLAAYSNAPQPQLLLDKLGQWWASAEVGLKPYPSCRLTHAAIGAALALRARLAPGALNALPIRLRLSPKAVQIVGEASSNKLRSRSIVDGQFSVYFQVAVALLDGVCNWDSYRRLGATDVESLAARIRVEAGTDILVAGAELSVGATDDMVEKVDAPLGEPERPLEWGDLLRKYHDLVDRVYGAHTATEIARGVDRLERLPNVCVLTAMLRAGKS